MALDLSSRVAVPASALSTHAPFAPRKRRSGARALDVVSPHIPSLLVRARALARNDADARDLVQDTCVCALVGLQRMAAPPANMGAWLRVILKNVWLNIARSRRAQAAANARLVEERADRGLLEARVSRTQLARMWRKIPPAARRIATACLVDGEGRDVVSARTGVAPAAIDASIYRTRKALREAGLGA
jgi:DNA-directed RNA polymerase specialized sigma24 family protein